MASTSESAVPAAPFDAVAAEYDQFEENIVTPRLREQVIDTCLRYFKQGMRILELNAGTCTDAITLARRGIEVLATDASNEMLSIGRRKIASAKLDNKIQVEQRRFNDIGDMILSSPIQGVFSDFGGLNCAEDLGKVLKDATQTLASGEAIVVSILNRMCAWELLRYALRGQFRQAVRRFSPTPIRAEIGGGASVLVTYFSPRQVILLVSEYLIPVEIYGLSIFSPLPNSITFMKKHPKLTLFLLKIDRLVDHLPVFRALGDHFVLVARKK